MVNQTNDGRDGEARARQRVNWTRRKMLLAGALGGVGTLAGCGGGGDDDDGGIVTTTTTTIGDVPGTDTTTTTEGDGTTTTTTEDGQDTTTTGTESGVVVEGQTLRVPVLQNPEQMHLIWDVARAVESQYEEATAVYSATHEPAIWGRWWHPSYHINAGESFPGIYESWEVTPEKITVNIREDANWSDGEPVRAYDANAQMSYWRWPQWEGEDPPGWHPGPSEESILAATGNVEMPDGPDGKVFELHLQDPEIQPAWLEAGGYEMTSRGNLLYRLGGFKPRMGVCWPSHIEPYNSLAEEAIENFDSHSEDGMHLDELASRHVSDGDVEASRDPDWFVSHGAWTLDEIRGAQEVVLTPNEYHRHYEDINFDEVILEYSEEERRTRAALQSGRLDYAEVEASPETVRAFPGKYAQITIPASTGYGLGLDHSTVFGDVRVRQAIMYALDTPSIAQNIHPEATAPVLRPGGDLWAINAVLDQEWIEENLVSYEQDTERAAQLMREAGFTRQDGTWQRDGERFSYQIATDSQSPVFETSVANQLQNFGLDVGFQTYEPATFSDRQAGSESLEPIEEEYGGTGQFAIWSGGAAGRMAGFYDELWGHWWGALAKRSRMRMRNYFDHDAQEESLTGYADGGWVAGSYPVWEELTIDVPPIGEPDGERRPFNPSYTGGRVTGGPIDFDDPQEDNPYYTPGEGGYDFFQKFAWTANWFLPVLPLVRSQNQLFANDANWQWPDDIGGEANEYMWKYFGMGWDTKNLATMDRIRADPENPKSGSNVVER